MLKLKTWFVWWVSLHLSSHSVCLSLENGLARTPPLGYSTWNFYPHVGINESTCYAQADAIVRTGLRDAGYKLFIVDEPCFTGRDSRGNLIENNITWPHGLNGFADYLHARGMFLETYTDQGPRGCGGCIASEDHEMQDMATFANWGVDYVKVDSCNRDVEPEHWAKFRDAINATGRPMVFSIIAQGQKQSWTWGNATGNLWRTTHDIMNSFEGFVSNLDIQESVESVEHFAGPGGWNDPDMPIVGTKTFHGGSGITVAEARAHFSLWHLDLLIGADVTKMGQEFLNILLNEEVLAVNQDRLGAQARKIRGPRGNDQLYLNSCSKDNPYQQWVFNSSGAVWNPKLNQCLTVEECSIASGAAVIMYRSFPNGNACHYGNQIWHYDSRMHFLRANVSGLCLDEMLQQTQCNAVPSSEWIYNDGLLMESSDTNMCLTAPGNGSGGSGEIYGGPLEWGAYAAVLFNRQTTALNITLNFSDLGMMNDMQPMCHSRHVAA